MDVGTIEQLKEKLLQSRAELVDLLAERDDTGTVELDQSRLPNGCDTKPASAA